MPKVSIIMGVYNCKDKAKLKKSVESIQNQTYQNWELVICNDGSTDDTPKTLEEIKQLDSRIKIVSYEKNHGLAYALNYALRNSKGEYIARQDDDDYSEKTRIEKEVNFLDNNPQYAMVGTAAIVYDDDGIWGDYPVEEKPTRKTFLWNNPFIHPVMMMRKEALEAVQGYRIAKETRRCEDYDLFMRMYAKGYLGYNLQEKLYRYYKENNRQTKYRPMKSRLEEAKVRLIGYRKMHILMPGIFFVFKPIIIGLIPQKFFRKIEKTQY